MASRKTETPTLELGQRYIESEGGFSYIPPSGWEVVEFPGLKYKIARGVPTGDFAPNINFVDEAFSGSLDDYVTASLNAISQFFKDEYFISQEEFMTNEGQRSVKVIIENTQNGIELIQVFYFFDAGTKKFVVTYSRSADNGQENDILVDQSMKTFRIEK